jgi:polysaccharide export outer membrane protein
MLFYKPNRQFKSLRLGLVTAFSIFALFSLFFLLSCASTSPKKVEGVAQDQMKEVGSSKQIRLMNEKILMGAASASHRKGPGRDYRIGPEDLLEISLFEDEKLNRTARVSSQGNITFPPLGVLRVEGLTANQLEREIRDLLAEKYYQDPHVTVFIKEYRSQRISIIGAVEKPGIVDVMGQKTILDVLALAGGLKEDAGQLLFLIRPLDPEDGNPETKDESNPETKQDSGEQPLDTLVIDLEELLVKGDRKLNLPLRHGDVINIPVSGKIFVTGAVNRPGGFPLKGKRLTVSQAIAMAEGLKLEAEASQTTIFRYGENGDREIHSIDLNAIQKGDTKDLYLLENDVIVVPKSGVKSFFIELRDTIKGIFGIGFSLGTL